MVEENKEKADQVEPKEEPGHRPNGELIGIDQAAELLKITRSTFYRWLRAGRVKGMKVGRQWRFYREDIKRFLKGQEPRIDLPADIGPLISDLRMRAQELGAEDIPSPEDIPEDDADRVIQAVDIIITLAIRMGASDVHLAAYVKEGGKGNTGILRYRIDGALYQIAEIDTRLLPAIVERWKTLAGCDVLEKVKSQDSRIIAKIAGKEYDLRVCFLPAVLGESITARISTRAGTPLGLEDLGFSPRDIERVLRHVESPWGTIIVSGPTGSGKTTVLYAFLNHVSRPEVKVITVEDPVEHLLPSAVQVQVRPDAGVTFADAVNAILRSDPDIIMIGEVRDVETLELTMQCALTGHLVMTQLHVSESVRGLKRMAELGIDPHIIGEAVKVVTNQRLVRKLCSCSVKRSPAAELLDRAAELARAGGIGWDSLPRDFREPVGCAKCKETGYKGRIAITEVLEVTPKITAALERDASLDELRTIAIGQGMTTISANGIRAAAMGITSLTEVLRVAG